MPSTEYNGGGGGGGGLAPVFCNISIAYTPDVLEVPIEDLSQSLCKLSRIPWPSRLVIIGFKAL